MCAQLITAVRVNGVKDFNYVLPFGEIHRSPDKGMFELRDNVESDKNINQTIFLMRQAFGWGPCSISRLCIQYCIYKVALPM